MPFRSKKQRRYLHANEPEVAEDWEEEINKWWSILLKIKTPDGHNLEISNLKNMKTMVKTIFREASDEVWGPAGRQPYIRTEHLRSTAGGPYNFWLTFRLKEDSDDRKVYNFILNHEGTTLLHFYGPGIVWGNDKVFSNEAEFYSELRIAIRDEIRTITIRDPKSIELETGKSELDIKLELEAANPGYKYINGRMEPDPDSGTERTVSFASKEPRVIIPKSTKTKPKTRKQRRLPTTRGRAVSNTERKRRRAEDNT